MSGGRLERIVFVMSAATLSFILGYGAHLFGYFPSAFIERGISQIVQALGTPHFVTPRVHDRTGARIANADGMQPGLTLVATRDPELDWQASVVLLAADGTVAHRWSLDPLALFPETGVVVPASRGVHGMHLLPGGHLLVNVNHLGIARLDACGEPVWRLANGAHHSIAPADDGTFWISVGDTASVPSSARYPDGYPGLDRPVVADGLARITVDGEVVESIPVLDVLFANGLERYLSRARVEELGDLMHLNDVEPLPAGLADSYPSLQPGDLMVSLRAPNLVFIMDPASLEVRWYASEPFVQQHDPDFIGDGWIGVFNNNWDDTDRGTLLGGTQILAVQPHSDSLKVLFPTSRSEPFYTAITGKWQLLANGNMLLTEGEPGRVLEVDAEGRTLWEWIEVPFNENEAVTVTEGTRVDLDPAAVRAWSCDAG